MLIEEAEGVLGRIAHDNTRRWCNRQHCRFTTARRSIPTPRVSTVSRCEAATCRQALW